MNRAFSNFEAGASYNNPNVSKFLIWNPILLDFQMEFLPISKCVQSGIPNVSSKLMFLIQIFHFSKWYHLLSSCSNKKSGYHLWLISTSLFTWTTMSAPPPKQILHLSHLSPWPNPSNVLIYYKCLLTHILLPFFSLIYSSQDCQRNLLENKLDYIKTPN